MRRIGENFNMCPNSYEDTKETKSQTPTGRIDLKSSYVGTPTERLAFKAYDVNDRLVQALHRYSHETNKANALAFLCAISEFKKVCFEIDNFVENL